MYRRLLVPMDSSAAAKRGLEAATGLATEFDAQLRLVHVLPTEAAGRTGLPRLVHGSYEERLIRHSPIPILLAPLAGSASRNAGRLCEESAQ